MRPLIWALKEVDPVGLQGSQAYMLKNAFKFKIAPHKQISIIKKNNFDRKIPPPPRPPDNGALYLSTHKHNGKSGPV